jgi:protein TonB
LALPKWPFGPNPQSFSPEGRDRLLSFFAALLIHGLLFTGAGRVLYEPAQFSVSAGTGSVEVSLVGSEEASEDEPADAGAQFIAPAQDEPEKSEKRDSALFPPTSGEKRALSPFTVAGAQGHAQPDYLANPAPRYPDQARRLGQEGLVQLSVNVNVQGDATQVKIKQGSGFSLLDEAALKAVRRWRFHPAKLGGLPVDSNVEVPIRFRLNEE